MPRFGKPDQRGRSSGILTGREKKLRSPPNGEPFVWLTRELLASPAWRALSINGQRLLFRLLIEDMAHAGRENGRLMATHDQLVEYGIPRGGIRAAIEHCQALGLIEHYRGGRWAGTNRPSRFRLTFYADAEGNPATNEWKGITQADIDALDRRKPRSTANLRNQKAGSKDRTTVVRKFELPTPIRLVRS